MASATRGPPHRSTRPSLNLPRLESTPNMCLLAVEHLKPQPPPKKRKSELVYSSAFVGINQDSCRLGSGWRLRPTIRSICICNLTHTNTHTTPMSCLGDCLATTPSIPFARRMTELARHAPRNAPRLRRTTETPRRGSGRGPPVTGCARVARAERGALLAGRRGVVQQALPLGEGWARARARKSRHFFLTCLDKSGS